MIRPQLIQFINNLNPSVPNPLTVTMLTSADKVLMEQLLGRIAPEYRSKVKHRLMTESVELAEVIGAQCRAAHAAPPVILIALILQLFAETEQIDQDPWNHPWIKEALAILNFGPAV